MKNNQNIPSKRIKKQACDSTPQCLNSETKEEHYNQCNCNGEKEVQQICGALISLQNYTKYISVAIRHHEKSLSTLPESIRNLSEFSELSSRIQSTIARAKINNEFLQKISEGYSKQLLKEMHKNQKDLTTLQPNLVLHTFILVSKEWSDLFQGWRKPLHQTVNLISKYQPEGPNKILVQGAGMGRILYQIATQINPIPAKIESIQDRPLHFLCGEFFVYKSKNESSKIYPYIHDFINHRKTQGPYKGVQVPSGLQKGWPCSTSEVILTNFGDFEEKYRSNENNGQWSILVSYLCTDRISNMLQWIQIAYKSLQAGGIWVLACFSSFEKNVLQISYGEFREIIGKSQFKILEEKWEEQFLNEDPDTMVSEVAEINYLVLQK